MYLSIRHPVRFKTANYQRSYKAFCCTTYTTFFFTCIIIISRSALVARRDLHQFSSYTTYILYYFYYYSSYNEASVQQRSIKLFMFPLWCVATIPFYTLTFEILSFIWWLCDVYRIIQDPIFCLHWLKYENVWCFFSLWYFYRVFFILKKKELEIISNVVYP